MKFGGLRFRQSRGFWLFIGFVLVVPETKKGRHRVSACLSWEILVGTVGFEPTTPCTPCMGGKRGRVLKYIEKGEFWKVRKSGKPPLKNQNLTLLFWFEIPPAFLSSPCQK
jgi:hypothetical protein